nr:40S ribosomal protein S15-4-like [Tanacetum cinerariifolium]
MLIIKAECVEVNPDACFREEQLQYKFHEEGQEPDVAVAKKRPFKKFSFCGVDLDALLDMSTNELVKMFTARARRRFPKGLKRKPTALIKKLHKA